jgi:hypothetical protein
MGVHLIGVHLIDLYLIGLHLINLHLIGLHLMGVHLFTGVHLLQSCISYSRASLTGVYSYRRVFLQACISYRGELWIISTYPRDAFFGLLRFSVKRAPAVGPPGFWQVCGQSTRLSRQRDRAVGNPMYPGPIKSTAQPYKSWSGKVWEIVYADLNSEDSLANTLSDATTIFTVTDFFEPFTVSDPDTAMKIEYQQGVNMAKAALRTPTLEHWPVLPNSAKVLGGKHVVPHFAAKNKINEFI